MADNGGINITSASPDGAQIEHKYHKAIHDAVAVPVMELEDSSNSIMEEVSQFSIGNFFASGAFWLGVERLITVGYNDALFISCIPALCFGVTLSIVGFRQSKRRMNRLARYIPKNR